MKVCQGVNMYFSSVHIEELATTPFPDKEPPPFPIADTENFKKTTNHTQQLKFKTNSIN